MFLATGAAPALVMFLLAPFGGRPWAASAMGVAWTGFATAAAALSGGAASPLLAAFLIAPALAVRLGDGRAVIEAFFAAVFGYAVVVFAAPIAPAGVEWAGIAGGLCALLLALWILAAPADPAARMTRLPPAGVLPSSPIAAAPARSAAAIYAATMAHELRTPLTHILGFAEMMQAQIFGPLNEKYRDYAGLIRSSGGHLLALVNDLMDLAKIEAGKLQLEPVRFDARLVCAEVLAEAAGQAEPKRVALRQTGAESAPVLADPRALRQVLINLVGNAVKFTPAGGAVQLDLRRDGRDIVITMSDTGPGFPPGAFASLATPFTRADNVGDTPGAGLGLSLVRSLVEAQGGALSLANSDEGGAEVTVRLPVAII